VQLVPRTRKQEEISPLPCRDLLYGAQDVFDARGAFGNGQHAYLANPEVLDVQFSNFPINKANQRYSI